MRAYAIRDEQQDKAELQDLPTPEPGAGEVRIRVEATTINNIDREAASGKAWDFLQPHAFPATLGRDFAGTVDAVGSGVTDLVPGDRVTGVLKGVEYGPAGGFAEELVVDEDTLARIPDGYSSISAASIGLAAVTAHDLLEAVAVTTGDVVLVSGATGGVGAFAIQLAKRRGATVLATGREDDRDFVTGLGADHAIDYSDDISTAVGDVAPDGVDVVVHLAGDPTELAALVKDGGRFTSALHASKEQLGRTDVHLESVMAESTPAKLDQLLTLAANGDLQVPVQNTYALADADQAFAAFAGHKRGKTAVTVADGD